MITKYFVKDFCIYIQRNTSVEFLLIVMSLSDFPIRLMLAPQTKAGNVFYFLDELVRNLYNNFCKILVEFTGEAIWSWSLLCGKISNKLYSLMAAPGLSLCMGSRWLWPVGAALVVMGSPLAAVASLTVEHRRWSLWHTGAVHVGSSRTRD